MARSLVLVPWLLLGGAVSGCAEPEAGAPAADGTLVLELGGQGPSLREALRAAGVEVQRAPAPVVDASAERADAAVSPPAPQPTDATVAPRGDGAGERPTEPPAVPSAPRDDGQRSTPASPPAADSWFVVTLAEGQTPIHLARKHLGDGNRFREILALNGWTEQEARRLRAGQTVKIPKAAGGSRAPRR